MPYRDPCPNACIYQYRADALASGRGTMALILQLLSLNLA